MNPVGLLMRHWYNQNRSVLFLRAVSGHLRSSQTILKYCQLYHILEAYVVASHEIPYQMPWRNLHGVDKTFVINGFNP